MQREEVVPIVLHVEPTGAGDDGLELKRVPHAPILFRSLAVRACHRQQLAQCSGRDVRPLREEQHLVRPRMDDATLAGVPRAGRRPEQRHLRRLLRPDDQASRSARHRHGQIVHQRRTVNAGAQGQALVCHAPVLLPHLDRPRRRLDLVDPLGQRGHPREHGRIRGNRLELGDEE